MVEQEPVIRVPFGERAVDALAAAIAASKGDDALAPVTVVVPSAFAALTVRRRLAASGGLLGVTTDVRAGLVARLAGARSASDGRRLLQPVQKAALVRAVLDDDPTRLAATREHPATVAALVATFDELRTLDAADLVKLSRANARAAEIVQLHGSYRRLEEAWLDEQDLLTHAIDAVRAGDAVLDEIGTVIVHLPRRVETGELALLAALHERGAVRVIVGVAGHPLADVATEELCARLATVGLVASAERAPVEGGEPSPPTMIVRAADPSEEARTATRVVLDHLGRGAVPDRIAIVSRVSSPYTLLVQEDLAAAGIPYSAPAPAQLGQSLAGRALLGLLRWSGDGHRRDDLMRLLRAAPLRDPAGGATRPDRWDRIARDAGVVGGLEQWRQRLAVARRRVAERAPGGAGAMLPLDGETDGDTDAAPPAPAAERAARTMAELDALGAFVERVAADTAPAERRSWRALANWARRLLDQYVGGASAVARWPEPEQRSRDAVLELLDELGALDELDPAPGAARFVRTLEHELTRPAGRVGAFGRGVFVGRLSDVVGSDLDLVIVVGASEGTFPPRQADDPLLPARDRAVVGAALPRRGATAAEETRDAIAALAAAPSSVLTLPIADPRAQHTRQPAPFVLERCAQQLGEPVDTETIAHLRDHPRRPEWFVDLPSFEWWLAGGGAPATVNELDLRELLAARAAGVALPELPVVDAAGVRRGLDAARARIEGDAGPWTGIVGDWPELADDLGHPRSATSLQQWATCPFRYFLGHVLGVRPLEDPGEEESITPADRGSLVHAILEGYHRAEIEGTPVDIDDVATEIETLFRTQGRTGRPLLWDAEWRSLRRHLGRILEAGAAEEALAGVRPVAVEYRFGFENGARADEGDATAPPVTVELGNGRHVRFRGAVDRIDRSDDGQRVVVLDYKTGSAYPYQVLDADHEAHDIVARGTLLQLPVYAAAARARFPDADTFEAYYWFVGQRGMIELVGGPIDDAESERFRSVLTTIADGIEHGVFPARPGEEEWHPRVGNTHENCTWCEFDRVCPAGRGEQWVTLRERADVQAYVELAEGELP